MPLKFCSSLRRLLPASVVSRVKRTAIQSTSASICILFCCTAVIPGLAAQTVRMVIDGKIRPGDSAVPSTALIRILNSDSTAVKTISIYDPYSGKFGARLTTADGIREDEKILFRVILSATDSFMARVSNAVAFKGAELPLPAPNTKVEIFRNHVPILRRTLSDTTVNENQILRYRLVAIDLDGDTMLYRLQKAPARATMDSITGLFTWRPGFEDSGLHEVVFSVDDGYDKAVSKTTTIRVANINRPPTFVDVLPDTAIHEGQTIKFYLHAIDPDNDKVKFSQTGIPAGALFDSSEGTFAWTPTYEQSGRYIFALTVRDDSNSGTSKTSRITVLNINRPPTFTELTGDTSLTEGEYLEIPLATNDPDGDQVKVSLLTAPPGALLSSEGILSWEPTFRQSGVHEIRIQASDDSLKTIHTIRAHVANVNHAPSAPTLVRPAGTDTVVVNDLRPLVFIWTKSSDEDVDDTLSYTLHLTGGSIDTTVAGIRDTLITLNLRPRLKAASTYAWSLSVNDGWVSLPALESLTFRTAEPSPEKEVVGDLPKSFSLSHNYPNPFNPVTSIQFTIPERSFVRLTIWNMLGELVQELVADEKEMGVYESTFKAENLPSGVYLMKLEAHPVIGTERKDFISTKKMILVK